MNRFVEDFLGLEENIVRQNQNNGIHKRRMYLQPELDELKVNSQVIDYMAFNIFRRFGIFSVEKN